MDLCRPLGPYGGLLPVLLTVADLDSCRTELLVHLVILVVANEVERTIVGNIVVVPNLCPFFLDFVGKALCRALFCFFAISGHYFSVLRHW